MSDVTPFPKKFISPSVRNLRAQKGDLTKGLIVGPPVNITIDSISGSGSGFSLEQIRRAVLFWDEIHWPINSAIGFGGGPEVEFLEDAGVLKRSRFGIQSGTASEIYVSSFIDCFRVLESRNPGCWSLDCEAGGLDLGVEYLRTVRGAEVKLYNAVPIPASDVPLEEVLDFKYRRKDEVGRFNIEIDGFFESWAQSDQPARNLSLAQRRIAAACNDLISVTGERWSVFDLSSWQIGYSFNPMAAFGVYEVLERTKATQEMPLLALGAASVASLFSISRSSSPDRKSIKSSPYKYAVSINSKLAR